MSMNSVGIFEYFTRVFDTHDRESGVIRAFEAPSIDGD